MDTSIPSRFKKAWNVFFSKTTDAGYSPTPSNSYVSTTVRPDKSRGFRRNVKNKTILSSIYTRLAVDVAKIKIEHCRVDDDGRYSETVRSSMNSILNMEANIDQSGRNFLQDAVAEMFEYGYVALCPVDTDTDPDETESPNIYSMRIGHIVQWKPYKVLVEIWNERTGVKQNAWYNKDAVYILQNPFFDVMNENNSVVDRLTRKLAILDVIDEQSGSGKLDLIIQLPYIVKSEAKRQQAEKRRKDIEEQLSGSKYGIAYIDGTERVTQLNRAVENNLLEQIQYLTDMLYSQLGLTPAVFNGTASEQEMLNYYDRTIEPILSTICDELNRKYLTKTARTQGQTFMFFRDPFKLVPVEKLAEIADKFTRNEILTSNEIRAIIGYRPSAEPNADELRNKNLNQSPEAMQAEQKVGKEAEAENEKAEQKS